MEETCSALLGTVSPEAVPFAFVLVRAPHSLKGRQTKLQMRNSITPLGFGGSDENPEKQNAELQLLNAARHVNGLFKAHGWKAKLTPGLLAAAFRLNEHGDRDTLVEDTRVFFQRRAVLIPDGLETLPSPWLKTVPEVLLGTLKPHWDRVPYMITSLRLCNSMLCVAFAQETEPSGPTRTTRWDRLRITLNYTLRPNLWTSLTSEERLTIWDQRPDLREDLLGFYPCLQSALN